MTKRDLILFAVLVVLVAAGRWLDKRHANVVQSQDFSTWSRSVASPGPALPLGERQPQNAGATAAVAPAILSRENLDPDRLFALRQKHAGSGADKLSRSATETFRALPRGPTRKINSQSFQILGAWAVPKSQYVGSMGEILEEQNNYNVVAAGSGDSWKDLTVSNEARPVLINASNGRVAIVTGTLVVTLKNLENVGSLADAESLKILGVDDQINTVYLKAPPGYSLLKGVQRLQGRADVVQAEMELDQSRKGAK